MTAFSLNFDYRCPGTYVVHDNVLDGLAAGADWDITFQPFSLGQVHVADGELAIWDRPGDDSGLAALQVAVTVRDRHPDAFLAVHRGLFELRHRRGARLERRQIDAVLDASGISPADIWPHIDDGSALDVVQREHTDQVKHHQVFGVPTFVVGDQAVFVRLDELSDGDGELAVRRIARILDLITGAPDLNEFKHTSLTR